MTHNIIVTEKEFAYLPPIKIIQKQMPTTIAPSTYTYIPIHCV